MKLRNIIAAGLMASMALVACNKENTVEPGDGSLKSVTIRLANVVSTKSSDVTPIEEDEAVKLNNFQVFFADAADKFYSAYGLVYDENAPISTYVDLENGGEEINTYHYLDAAVSKVYVVANLGEEKTFANLNELKAALDEVKIEDQQATVFTNLKLFGKATQLDPATAPSDEQAIHGSNYYTAKVTVAPLVSRIQINSAEYRAIDETPRLYTSLDFTQFALNKYYETASLTSLTETFTVDATGLSDVEGGIDDTNVWGFLDGVKGKGWYSDNVDFILNEASSYKVEDLRLAYHFFPGETVPQIIARFDGTDATGVSPLFLATIDLDGVDNTVGKIYNVAFSFDDNDIKNPLKCVQIEVDVLDWVVTSATPIFRN